ncbi:MAG: regulatory protein RecX [Clostridia bacterium]|nr:regulatory protein RecX [Clostridia bacterium]
MRKQQTLDTYDKVKEKALRLLEFRSHSEFELTQKLRHHGASSEHIEDTLEFCRRYGFLNDVSYAQRKAHDLIYLKKYGIRRVKSELKVKGISDDIIENVISAIDPDAECDALVGLVEKKLRGDFSDKNSDKCIRYFVYRGYDIYDIKDAMQTVKERSDCTDEI